MSKKRKFTFNIIDALIILFLVALITFTVYFFVLGKSFGFSSEDEASTETVENTEHSITDDSILHNINFNEYNV